MSANGLCCSALRFLSLNNSISKLLRCAGLASLFLVPATATYAATYTVSNLNDSGSGSLRAAITSANADAAGNIVFASGVAGTINLQSSLPNITLASGTMTITGPGANKLTISGQSKYQVMVIVKGNVTISGVTIANGFIAPGGGYAADPGWGAAVYTAAGTTLTLKNDMLVNNVVTAGGGGAILSEGVLNISGTTLMDNAVSTYTGGGAIFNLGALTVTGSTFSFNTTVNEGSAILNYGPSAATATIVDSTFANNLIPAGGGGGGIYNESGAKLTVRNSTFSGNLPATGGSIANAGTMTLSNDIFAEPTQFSFQCTAAPAPASQCPANPSAPDTNGNFDQVATSLGMLPLGYYGGLAQTVLPQTGSPLICGGTTAGALNVSGGALTSDERGFTMNPSCATGKVDAGAVQSKYLIVTTTGDAGDGTCDASCTLRDAIMAANASGHADIGFASGVGGTITLASALPAISGMADIVGPGANLLMVSGNNLYPAFNVTTGTLDLAGLSMVNGKSASNGGAIQNTSGLVTLSNVVLSNNTAVSNGGAINNGGTVIASDTTFSGNKAVLGSAIYNTGALSLTYSTVAGNAASSAGGIYNNSGAAVSLANTTFAANTGTGAGIDNLGGLTGTNTLLDASAECAGSGCPTSGNGNVVSASVAALGNYGGTMPTVLPLPGSTAICGGSAALIPANALTDQRGFANENLTYTGYSSTAPCADSGAVQTNYTSVQFVSSGLYVATAGKPGTTPAVVVSVTESGQNVGGVPVTLTFSGTGSATGLTATTVAGIGATFNSIQATTAAASGDTLSVKMPVVGADLLTASPVALTVNPGAAPPFTVSVNPPNETLFAGDIAIFLVQLQASNGFNGKVALSCSGGPAGAVCINFPMTVSFYNGQALAIAGAFFPPNTAPGTYTLTFTGVSGSASSTDTATFTVQPMPKGWFW